MNNNKSVSQVVAFSWIVIAYLISIALALCYLSLDSLQGFRTDNLLINTFIADVIATIGIFIFSRIFQNSSFYDAYWSVIPPLIFHYWLMQTDKSLSDPIVLMLGGVIWYWAIRLTWNWAKHWEGLSHEDWRYVDLKANKPNMLALIIDFFAIHFFPTVQVFLGLLPVYACLILAEGSWSPWSWLAFGVGLLAPTVQLMADRQLHAFIAVRKPGEIIHSGLWAWSRHPNYFGELLFWFSLALFGVLNYLQGFWWESLGFIAMLVMFLFASIPMMEKRSLERRPNYQDIIDSTSMLIPLPPKR
ncbi:MAG: DUF1295 domain-containing protein [Cellvibrionales bacterium]|nr:DUF1295 domain-containing protein [Cellvibrionales bacterium]